MNPFLQFVVGAAAGGGGFRKGLDDLKRMRCWWLAALLAGSLFLQGMPLTAGAAIRWEEAEPDGVLDDGVAEPDDPQWVDTSAGYSSSSGSIPVRTLERLAEEYDNVPEDFLDAISRYDSLSLSRLEKLVLEHKAPLEYIQRCFNDRFVFNAGDKLDYVLIDDTLAKNPYNWDYLDHRSSGEIRYVDGDISRALKGIDVSVYQGDIDWERVKADGVRFAFIRLGYRGYGTGKIQIDEKFKQNIRGATRAGIKVGVYFYSQAISTREALEEAKTVLKYIDGYDIDYPVVYDVEDAPSANARTRSLTGAQATKNVTTFCNAIQKAGYRPMVYANSKWFAQKLDLKKLEKYDKWLAQYYKVPFFPYDFSIWQYTGKGRVDGIKGDVDMNLSFIDY